MNHKNRQLLKIVDRKNPNTVGLHIWFRQAIDKFLKNEVDTIIIDAKEREWAK